MEPWHCDDRATIYHGDCIEVLRGLPDASVDSVVTDPPYGLEFMGKDWDAPWKGKASREFNEIEPGSLGGFSQLPNHSRVNNVKCAACDRWKFSSNPCKCAEPDFPNARLDAMLAFQLWCQEWVTECLRVLKPGGHLLAFGGTRTWHRLAVAVEDAGFEVRDSIAWLYGSGFPKSHNVAIGIDKAAGAMGHRGRRVSVAGNRTQGQDLPNAHSMPEHEAVTEEARRWSGWGTALKPAFEPVVVARKPLTGTVAANVLEHGVGGLNIDGCRIGTDGGGTSCNNRDPFGKCHGHNNAGRSTAGPTVHGPETSGGRWPANVVLDEDQADALDKQSGVLHSQDPATRNSKSKRSGIIGFADGGLNYADRGGASRFFYVAKAPARERPKVDGIAHPTVKPLTLMRWLCRLVTPPGGVVLEPFAGSGTTIEAALMEGFRVVAIEREDDYLPLIAARLERVAQEPDDGQLTFDASA